MMSLLWNMCVLSIFLAACAVGQNPPAGSAQQFLTASTKQCKTLNGCWHRCTDRNGQPYCMPIKWPAQSIISTYPGIPNHGVAYSSLWECRRNCKKTTITKIISGYVTADDILMSTCADGVQLTDQTAPNYDNWRIAKWVTMPGDTKIFGVHARDLIVAAGIMAKLSNGVITNKDWKCTYKNPGRGWCTERFDDSAWVNANPTFARTAHPWGNQPGLSSLGNAEWIWGSYFNPGQINGQAKTKESWCRVRFCNGQLCLDKEKQIG